ncbi:MAG: hypothetical protein NTY07_04625 [Bacteroidia bacterium]|nr:hypothetical protein [Bacteroidia bacterium]
MGKKISIGITILLISGLLAGWYFFTHEAKYFGTSAFRAVPENVSVIVRIHHLGNYTARSLNNPIWKAYSGFPGVTSLYQQLSFADSLFKMYPKANNTFIDKDLTVMFGGENDHFRNLSLVELSSLSEKRAMTDFVENYFSLKEAAKENVKVGGANFSCYSWNFRIIVSPFIGVFFWRVPTARWLHRQSNDSKPLLLLEIRFSRKQIKPQLIISTLISTLIIKSYPSLHTCFFPKPFGNG